MAIADIVQKLIPSISGHDNKVLKIDEQSSSFGYFGIAPAGSLTSEAKWIIYRVYRQGTVYTVEMAPDEDYVNIWDDRTTLFSSLVLNNAYSLDFDGVNDLVDYGNNYTFEVSQAFSISFWVKPNNLAAQRCMISKCSNDANVWGYNIQHAITTGQIMVQMRTPASSTLHTFTTALTAGVWQHIVMTFSGNSNINGVRTYRNATIGDTPASAALASTWTNLASFVIGARNTAFPFSGLIDEVSVWNVALSQSEVTELYNSGQPGNLNDHSAYNNLQSWWRMGDNDTYPTILDQKGSVNGTMTNMASNDIVSDVP